MYSSLGRRMAEAFDNTRLSQTEFAKESGIDQSHLSKLLAGKRHWNESLFRKANEALRRLGFEPVSVAGAPMPHPNSPDYKEELERYKAREDRLWEMIADLKTEVAELKKASTATPGMPSRQTSPEKKRRAI